MKPNKIHPNHPIFHDQPSNVKLQHILQDKYLNHHIHQIQLDIFTYLNLQFKINQIFLKEQQHLHTIFIPTEKKQHKHKVIYMTHGFGGSSLMYFPVIKTLLQYGNVILWELRGMGLSKKLPKYNVQQQEIEEFFVHPIQLMLKYYFKYKEIYFISHSFGGYLTLLYLLKNKTFTNKIKQVILLSPVGITPKEQDYKSKVKGISDCLHVVGNRISWTFGLTYKSPFRCLCVCMKQRVFEKAVKGCGFVQEEERLMKELLIAMVDLKDGSENVFFNYFQPRVMPKFPIQPIFKQPPPVKIKIFYGGEQDWVDKTGAERLQSKYPQKIQIKIIKQSGHNFPFFPEILQKQFQQIFTLHHHHRHYNEQKNQEKQKIHDLMSHEIYESHENSGNEKSNGIQYLIERSNVSFG